MVSAPIDFGRDITMGNKIQSMWNRRAEIDKKAMEAKEEENRKVVNEELAKITTKSVHFSPSGEARFIPYLSDELALWDLIDGAHAPPSLPRRPDFQGRR